MWAARRWVRGREAGLLGPLAEPLRCHPSNFSTQRARRGERGEDAGEARGGGGSGGRGGSGRRSAPRMRPARGAAPRPARPEGPLRSPPRGRVSHRPAPARSPRRPGPRALARDWCPRCRGSPAGLRARATPVQSFAGARRPGSLLELCGLGAQTPPTSRSPAARAILSSAFGECWNPEACLSGTKRRGGSGVPVETVPGWGVLESEKRSKFCLPKDRVSRVLCFIDVLTQISDLFP